MFSVLTFSCFWFLFAYVSVRENCPPRDDQSDKAWSRCSSLDECLEWLMDLSKGIQFAISMEDVGHYTFRKKVKCGKFDTSTHITWF